MITYKIILTFKYNLKKVKNTIHNKIKYTIKSV